MRVICPHCLAVNNIPQKQEYKKANCGKCKNSLLDKNIVELTNENFDEVIVNSDIPVIVDFWAPWCGPCKMMAPVFGEVSGSFALKVLFAKVNTEDQQMLGSRFGIRSIPTLAVFKNGTELNRVSGALDKASLINFANQYK
jgi:thioredoxin 2